LKLHSLTLGTPHRSAEGHTDNAILLLHGTGGNAHSFMNPTFAVALFDPGSLLDIRKISSSSRTTSVMAKVQSHPIAFARLVNRELGPVSHRFALIYWNCKVLVCEVS
jgi:hypothetical protein